MTDKQADLAGPGIGTYEEVAVALPGNYQSLLSPRETMQAWHGVKNYIEENLCRELNLMMVQVPLIVDRNSGVNDMLDRDGSRAPVEFPCGLGLERPIDAQAAANSGPAARWIAPQTPPPAAMAIETITDTVTKKSLIRLLFLGRFTLLIRIFFASRFI